MTRCFTIVVIDDHHENMTKDLDEIKDYLEDKGFALQLRKSKKMEELDNHLNELDADIILADKNLGQGKTGKDVVEHVRQKKILADILYYSAVSIDDNDIIELAAYLSVEVIRERTFVPTLKKMINKNLLKWQDVVFLRGMIISKTIELEIKVNGFLATYFEVPDAKLDYFGLMLEGTTISLEGKKITLKEIIKTGELEGLKDLYKNIQHVQVARNILAHSTHDPVSKSFTSRGKEHAYDKDKMMKILNTVETASQNLDDATATLKSVHG